MCKSLKNVLWPLRIFVASKIRRIRALNELCRPRGLGFSLLIPVAEAHRHRCVALWAVNNIWNFCESHCVKTKTLVKVDLADRLEWAVMSLM